MCAKRNLKVCYYTKDYTNGKLVSNRKKVLEDNCCYRCTYNKILTCYLTLDVPFQLVDTCIDDECADMVFELNYRDALGTHRRCVRVIVCSSEIFKTLDYE